MADSLSPRVDSPQMAVVTVPTNQNAIKTSSTSIDETGAYDTQLDGLDDSDIFCITSEFFQQITSNFCWGGDVYMAESIWDDEGREISLGEEGAPMTRARHAVNHQELDISTHVGDHQNGRRNNQPVKSSSSVVSRGGQRSKSSSSVVSRGSKKSKSSSSVVSRGSKKSKSSSSVVSRSSQRSKSSSSVVSRSSQRSNGRSVSSRTRRSMKPRGINNDTQPTTSVMTKSKSSQNVRNKLLPKKSSFRTKTNKKEMNIIPEAIGVEPCLSAELEAEIYHCILEEAKSVEEKTKKSFAKKNVDNIIIEGNRKQAVKSTKKKHKKSGSSFDWSNLSDGVQDALFLDSALYDEMKEEAGYFVGMLMGSGPGQSDETCTLSDETYTQSEVSV